MFLVVVVVEMVVIGSLMVEVLEKWLRWWGVSGGCGGGDGGYWLFDGGGIEKSGCGGGEFLVVVSENRKWISTPGVTMPIPSARMTATKMMRMMTTIR